MTALCLLVVLASSTWLFGWGDLFHLAVGAPVLAACAVGWHLVSFTHRRALRDDPDGLIHEDHGGPLGRSLRGLVAGVALSAALGVAFTIASKTPLYAKLTDADAKKLLSDLSVLERLGQWREVESRLATLPATSAPSHRTLLAEKKVIALIKLAESEADVASACELYRRAEQAAVSEGVDASLVKAKLEWCEARAARRPLPARARADIVRLDRLGPDTVRVEVRVVDEADRPLAGLVAEDFTVTTGAGQTLKVAALSVEEVRSRPGHRVSVLVDQAEGARNESVAAAAYLVAGLGPGDSVEVVGCGPSSQLASPRTDDPVSTLRAIMRLSTTSGCAIADALWFALDRLGAGPRRSVVLIGGDPTAPSARSWSEVSARASSVGVPVFVVPTVSSADELRRLAGVSGGFVFDPPRRDTLDSLRSRIRSNPGSSPLTYVLTCTGLQGGAGRLDMRIGGANAATATTRF